MCCSSARPRSVSAYRGHRRHAGRGAFARQHAALGEPDEVACELLGRDPSDAALQFPEPHCRVSEVNCLDDGDGPSPGEDVDGGRDGLLE
jgi:hypothetical protein